MTTITFIGIGPMSKCIQPNSAWTSYRRGVQWSRCRQAVPGEAYTYGSWRGVFDCLRPRRDVVDAVDADEAIDGCSEPRLWRLQLNITRQGFVGGCGTSRGGEATFCTPSTRAEAL